MANAKNYVRATSGPQLTDDSSKGYSVGSIWIYDGHLYICRSANVGAAVWVRYSADQEAWPSRTYRYPDNCNGMLGDITPAVGTDLFGVFPFMVSRPFNSAGVSVSAAGSSGSAVSIGVYAHDELTGRPGERIANMGNTPLTSIGMRTVSNATVDWKGLIWVSVHVKLIGVTTAPTYVGMTGANGKHVHRGDGSDLAARSLLQHYSSTDTYTTSPPSPIFGTAAINRLLPCPALLSA